MMQRYRVECNYGSSYFDTAVKAFAFYNKKKAQNLDVEIWLVTYDYSKPSNRYSATQELLEYSFSKFPKTDNA